MKILLKIVGWIISLAVVALAVFCYFKFWFVYAEGTDTGELNYFTRQGYVFKTYEGKLIQTGFRSGGATASSGAGIRSNEFLFSVENERVADMLMHSTGKQVELHYKRYGAPLPWRGNSTFVVDSIWSVTNSYTLPNGFIYDDAGSNTDI